MRTIILLAVLSMTLLCGCEKSKPRIDPDPGSKPAPAARSAPSPGPSTPAPRSKGGAVSKGGGYTLVSHIGHTAGMAKHAVESSLIPW